MVCSSVWLRKPTSLKLFGYEYRRRTRSSPPKVTLFPMTPPQRMAISRERKCYASHHALVNRPTFAGLALHGEAAAAHGQSRNRRHPRLPPLVAGGEEAGGAAAGEG